MAEPIQLPEKTTFQLGESAWRMDMLGMLRAVESVEETGQRLTKVKEYVQKSGGPELDDDQADWLFDHCNAEYARKKKERRSALHEMLESPLSTE